MITPLQNYEVFFKIPNIKNETLVGIQIDDKNTSILVAQEKFEKLGFKIGKNVKRNNLDLSLTLVRNSAQCSTKTMKIKVDRQKFHTFIQMDKSIHL